MRILVLNYEFPPVGGGGGRAAEEICLGLASRGHEIRVQTAWVKGLPFTDRYNGITVYRSFAFRHRSDRASVLEMGLYIVTGFLPTLRHVQEWEPHIIHAHFAVPTGALAWLVARFTRVPYVLTAHLGDVPDAVPEQTKHLFRIVKPLTYPIWKDAAAVVAVSRVVRDIALQSYHVPIEVIPNGVDLAAAKLSPTTSSVPLKMIFAGRLNPQKNLSFLVNLLAEVRDLPWEMNILGDGPLMEEVKAQSRKLKLEERIYFHGWVGPNIVDEMMAQSDILIMPSITEGLPVAGIAALAHGLAILGSNIDGLADIVDDGINGYLCPVNDLVMFTKALRLMLTSKDMLSRMKAQSRKNAERFDLAHVVEQYEKVLEKAAS